MHDIYQYKTDNFVIITTDEVVHESIFEKSFQTFCTIGHLK